MIQGTAGRCSSSLRGTLRTPMHWFSLVPSARAVTTSASDLSLRASSVYRPIGRFSSALSPSRTGTGAADDSHFAGYYEHPLSAVQPFVKDSVRPYSSFSVMNSSRFLRGDPDQDKEKAQGRGQDDKEEEEEDKEDREEEEEEKESDDEKDKDKDSNETLRGTSREDKDDLFEDDMKMDYETLRRQAESMEKAAEEERVRNEKKEKEKKKDTWYRKNGKIKLSVILGGLFLLIYGPSVAIMTYGWKQTVFATLFSRVAPIVLDRPELEERLGKGYRVQPRRKAQYNAWVKSQKEKGIIIEEKEENSYRGGTLARQFQKWYDDYRTGGRHKYGVENWLMYRSSTGDLYWRFRFFLRNRLDFEDGPFQADFAMVSCEYIMRKGDWAGGFKPGLVMAEFPDGEIFVYAFDGEVLVNGEEGEPMHYAPDDEDQDEGYSNILGDADDIFEDQFARS